MPKEVRQKITRCAWLKKYGLTPEEYERMLVEQGHACAICKRPERQATTKKRGVKFRLSIDHDHKTGKVRALLCHWCNIVIGFFEKSGAPTPEAVANYLEKYSGKQ